MAPLVTNAGKAIITNRIKGSGTEPTYIGIGTGSTAEAATQTALVGEVETRVSGTTTQQTTTATNDTWQNTATLSITATRALQESGCFDASSAGNMFCRGVFAVINLVSGDTITPTWKVQFT